MNTDESKTRAELLKELKESRQRLIQAEASEKDLKRELGNAIDLASFPELNPNPILELDQKGNIKYANPATLRLFPALTAIGIDHPFLADWTQVVKELQSSNWVKTVMRNVVVESLVYEQVLYPVAENQIRIYGRNITDRKEAEEKLRESQRRFKALVETTGDFIWEMNLKGVYTYCSPQMEKLWGLKPEEMLGKTPFDLLPPEDKEQAIKGFSTLMASASPFVNMEMRSFDGTGRIIFLEINGVPFFDIAGKHCGYRGIARDITERKLAEEALKASQHFNQSLLNSTPNLIYVYDLVKHRNEFANREVSDFLGYTAEEVQAMGSSLFAILLHPDDAAMVVEHHARCAAASDEDVLEIVYRMRNSSGQWRWLRSKDVAFRRDDKGAVTQILGSTEDITERKRLEEVLRQSERKFKAIALNCPDHILIQDKDLRYIFVLNPQLGLTEEDMIGKTDKDFLYEADAAQLTQIKGKVLRTGIAEFTTVSLVSKSGDKQYFEGTYVPTRDRQGQIDGLAGYFRNITERRQAEESRKIYAERLTQAQENAHIGNWDWDLATGNLYWSPENYRIFGLDPEKVKPSVETFLATVNPGDLERVKHAIQDSLDNQRPYDIDMGIIRPEGTKRFVNAKARVICNDSGKTVRMVGTVQDITERKQAEEQLSSQFAILNGIVESAGSPIFSVDDAYRYTSFNSSHAAIIKSLYGADIEIGKSLLNYHTVDKDREQAKKNIDRALSGEAVTLESWAGDTAALRRYFAINHTPIKDRNGKITGVAIFANDFTERKLAEEALRESEAFSSTLLENAPNPIFVQNSDRSIKYANPAWENLTGYSLKEVIGTKPPYPHWLEEEVDKNFAELQDSGDQNIFKLVKLFRKRNGERFWVELTHTLVKNLEGKTEYHIAEWINITERKQAEQTLEESEELMSSLLEDAPNSVMVTNPDFIITYVNPAVEKLTGYSKSELIGRGLPYPFWHVKDYEAYTQAITWNSSNGIFKLERLFYRKNGEPLWIEANSMPVKEGEQIKYHIFNWIDITERKKAEEKLKESEERYRTLFEKAVEGILISDSETRKFKYANPAICKMLGYSQEELTKMSVMDIHPEDSLTRAIAKFDARARGDISIALDMLFLKKDGAIAHADATGTKVSIDGKACNIGFFTDATERKALEAKTIEMEALKRINQAKSELLANVSHELRTPLTSIKGNIETLLETDVEWSKEQQLDLLQSANQQADRLTLLIRDLLDMSRIDSGKLTLDKRSYLVSEILDSISGVLSIITAKHKLKIKMLPDLPSLQADKVRIGQVITNLTENATKFSPEGSQIVIEAKVVDENIIFSVEDNGIGMPPEVVAKLFDRFYQSYQVVEGKTHGTGLGLSICKGIVEAHGGKIWAESQPGKSSKFSFSIPVMEDFKQGGIKGAPPL